MKNFGKIKLTEKDNLLSDSEMKVITGGYGGDGNCGSTQSQCFGSCTPSNGGVNDGLCIWKNDYPNWGDNPSYYRCSCKNQYA